MAEINTPASAAAKPGVPRSRKRSTRVDLTPMVDLGFLLITFFVFTTSMSKPVAMKLVMPAGDSKTQGTNVGQSAALTALLTEDGKIFYYHGELGEALRTGTYGTTTYSVKDGIGQVIREKQLAMDRSGKVPSKDLTLMIKPTNETSTRQLVDILDEVLINNLQHYAIMEITEAEREAVKARAK